MTLKHRVRELLVLSGMALSLVFAAGCNTSESLPGGGPGASPIVVSPGTPSKPGPIEDIKKDITTPTIIKPDQAPAPAAAPPKTR